MKRSKLWLGLITTSIVSIVWGAEGFIEETPLYTFAYAGKHQVNTPIMTYKMLQSRQFKLGWTHRFKKREENTCET